MKRITTVEQLKEEIALLEVRQETERKALRAQFNELKEAFKPSNMIRSAVKEVGSSTKDLQSRVIGSVLGLAVGYLSRKAIFRKSGGPIKKVAGTLFQMGVSGLVSKNAGGLRQLGVNLFQRLMNRRKKDRREIIDNVDQL